MPIQRREVQDSKIKQSPTINQSQSATKPPQSKQNEEPSKSSRVDETEAQVQKIVASVFKEHKIPLKHQNVQEQQDVLNQQADTLMQNSSQNNSPLEHTSGKISQELYNHYQLLVQTEMLIVQVFQQYLNNN